MLTWLKRDSTEFPPLTRALQEPDGLLAAGGDLSSARLLAAYRHGCFPWFGEGQPILWWSPDPRMVLLPENLHVAKSLRKSMRKNIFEVSFDRCFTQVIQACAAPRAYADSTWINEDIIQGYSQLHKLGYAHSVEVWQNNHLIGGLYGIAMGKLFFGESMFSRVTDASKIGFVTLVQYLKQAGFVLIDCQMHTQHLSSLGATEICRDDFSSYLTRYLDQTNTMNWSSELKRSYDY